MLGLDKGTSVAGVIGGMILTLVVIMVLFAIVNAGIEFVAYRRLRRAPRLAALITAVGMSFIIQNVSLAFYGVNFHSVPSFIPRTEAIGIGDVTYSWNKLSALLITIPVLILLSWFVRSTKQGKAMRAVAQDTEASAMMGINVNRTISVAFALAGALAGAAGIVYLLQFNMRYDTGFELGLIAFTAAVLGGIGNLAGAVLGALDHRLHPGLQRGSHLVHPGLRLDPDDRVRDPDPDPRLPAGGHPRRADAGGRVTTVQDRLRSYGPGAFVAVGADRPRLSLPEVRRVARRPAADRRLRPVRSRRW